MATSTTASVIIDLPIEKVWKSLRDFSTINQHISGIVSCELEDGGQPNQVGVIRTMKW